MSTCAVTEHAFSPFHQSSLVPMGAKVFGEAISRIAHFVVSLSKVVVCAQSWSAALIRRTKLLPSCSGLFSLKWPFRSLASGVS